MKSDQIDQLATALAKAQGEIKNPPRTEKVSVTTRTGRTYEFSYAPLDSIIDAIKKPFADNSIGYIQYVEQVEDKFRLITEFMHASGQWVSAVNPLFLTPQKDRDGNVLPPSSQDFGSALTFMKRYALAAMAGVAADTDDDANMADGNAAKFAPRVPDSAPAIKPPSKAAEALIAAGQTTSVNLAAAGGGDPYAKDTITVTGSVDAAPKNVDDANKIEMTGQAWRRFGEQMVKLARDGKGFTPEQQAKMSVMKKEREKMWQQMADAIADAQMTANKPVREAKKAKEPAAPPQPNAADDPDAYRLWLIDQLSQLETVEEVSMFTEEQSAHWKKCFPPDIEDWEGLSKERAKELGK